MMPRNRQSIRLLFADTRPSDQGDYTLQKYKGARGYLKGPWLWVFVEQCINSLIVGGIVFISTLGPGNELQWVPAAKGFGLTFLIELRKYRQLSQYSTPSEGG